MPRVPPKPTELTEVYIDESSQTNHRYFGFGALVIHKTCTPRLEQRIWTARMPDLPAAEMGWKKVSKGKLDAYKRFCAIPFERELETQPMHFHLMAIDSHGLKDQVYNDGSREVGFNKEVFQICMKMARLYKDRLFHIYLDSRTTKSSTEELRSMLNFKIRNKGDSRDWPFRRVHFRDSKESVPLQLTDTLLGAVMYRMNGHNAIADASPAKCALSDEVLHSAGIQDVFADTAPSGRFTIWHRQLK